MRPIECPSFRPRSSLPWAVLGSTGPPRPESDDLGGYLGFVVPARR